MAFTQVSLSVASATEAHFYTQDLFSLLGFVTSLILMFLLPPLCVLNLGALQHLGLSLQFFIFTFLVAPFLWDHILSSGFNHHLYIDLKKINSYQLYSTYCVSEIVLSRPHGKSITNTWGQVFSVEETAALYPTWQHTLPSWTSQVVLRG